MKSLYCPSLIFACTCCIIATLVAISTSLAVAKNESASSWISIANWVTSVDPVTGNAIGILVKMKDIVAERNINSINNNTANVDFAVKIDLNSQYQTITGYGAGLPQSSAFNLINLKRSSPDLYAGVMNSLFASNSDGGAGLNILRFPMGSCDFSISNTSYDEVVNDYTLSQFSVDSDSEFIIEVLQDSLKINPSMTIVASPWSAPSWLKVMDSLIGLDDKNTLIDDEAVYDTYASYFVKTISAYRQRGININFFTLQNEPLFGNSPDYPGMFLNSSQAYRLGQKLIEKMNESESESRDNSENDAQKTYILGYDHNWDNYWYPMDLLNLQQQANPYSDPEKPPVFTGIAWHCYGGLMPEALDALTQAYPNVDQHISECTGSFPDNTCDIDRGMEGFGYNHEWDMKNLFLGAVGHNAKSGTKWILTLDENCGPVLPTVSWRCGRPFVSIPTNASTAADIKYNQDYYTTSHMSRFFENGSVRVGRSISSSKSHRVDDILLECVVKNSISTWTTCIIMNLNHEKAYSLLINDGFLSFSYNIEPWATAVLQYSNIA